MCLTRAQNGIGPGSQSYINALFCVLCGEQSSSELVPREIRSALEEPHLHARQQDHIVVFELASLFANAGAVHLRIVTRLAAIHVDDEEAVGTTCNRSHLNPWAAKCRKCFVEFELATGECTA